MHGGSIEAHSDGRRAGRRSSSFGFPLHSTKPTRPTADEPRKHPGCGGRLKVLVVDDNADFVQMLATSRRRVPGTMCERRWTGGARSRQRSHIRPDVVLLDLGLPVMGGLEVARELRRRPEMAPCDWSRSPAGGRRTIAGGPNEAGFDYHLTKPTDPKELEGLLHQFASERP